MALGLMHIEGVKPPEGRVWRYSGKRGWYLGHKHIVPQYCRPTTYTAIMREASDNSAVAEPSQPAPEHAAQLGIPVPSESLLWWEDD